MMNEQVRTIIALSTIPKVGAYRIRLLFQRVKKSSDIFKLSEKELRRIPGIGPQVSSYIHNFNDWEKVDAIIDKTRKMGAQIISYRSLHYPARLREIYDSPLLLWVLGSLDVLNKDGLAVVGTRNPTNYGRQMARSFTEKIISQNMTVISGLAYGIDTEAHKTCVRNGGQTIAVLGSGLDVIYPKINVGLVKEIINNGGAVISEFPLGTQPDAGNFPVRNRIVSGMSMGVLVVESGKEGGSIITAKLALDQNREVFVVPHNNLNTAGVGCNNLIKRGMGKLVQEIEDIMEELPVTFDNKLDSREQEESPKKWETADLNKKQKAICKALVDGDKHIDDLALQFKLPSHKLLVELLNLEMTGYIEQTAGKYFHLK